MKAVACVFENWNYFESFGIKDLHHIETATEYYSKLSNSTEYGDQTEIEALSKAFDIRIEVFTNHNLYSATCVHNKDSTKVVRIHHSNIHYDHVKELRDEGEANQTIEREWGLIKFRDRKGNNSFFIGKIDAENRGSVDVHYVQGPVENQKTVYSFPDDEDKDFNVPAGDWDPLKTPKDILVNRKFCYEFDFNDIYSAKQLLI